MPDVWRFGAEAERARVAIVGCGGAGCNNLRYVVAPSNAGRIAINDAPHPSMAGIPQKVFVREGSLHGLASMDERVVPTLGSDEEKGIASAVLDRDLVMILAGLGGDFGGWAGSLVGRVVRVLGHTSIALATLPFAAEGILRMRTADTQLELLRRKADGVVTFSNDELLRVAPDLPLARAFAVLGASMARLAVSLASTVAKDDLVPLKRLLAKSKDWRYGVGAGSEKQGPYLAVDEAFRSPWFTSRHEDIRCAIALMVVPPDGGLEEEILHEIRIRSPTADVAWASVPDRASAGRSLVQVLAGL